MSPAELLRGDLRRIIGVVPDGTRVLDLGCGDGALMEHLRDERGCFVRGIELDHDGIAAALARGLSVVEADLDDGLAAYADGSFDVVILSQTLQVVRKPAALLREMLRVGERCVVSFPNFGYWRVRAFLAFSGRMPVAKSIPFSWDETPNIHHTTIRDFRDFAAANDGEIEREIPLRSRGSSGGEVRPVRVAPNLRADTVVAVVRAARSAGSGGPGVA